MMGATACGGSSNRAQTNECTAAEQLYSTTIQALTPALTTAEQCDSTAAVPCITYRSGCGFMGVNPGAVDALNAANSAYDKMRLACGEPALVIPCPCYGAPYCRPAPTYICQSGAGGVNECVEVPPCSSSAPAGYCPPGYACTSGTCVGLCSPTNPSGVCADGFYCSGGYCTAIGTCSPDAPLGPCPPCGYPNCDVGCCAATRDCCTDLDCTFDASCAGASCAASPPTVGTCTP
jgi:hypothetical protein